MGVVNNQWNARTNLAFDNLEMHPQQEETWEQEYPREVPAYHKRRRAGLWTAIATLAVALVAMGAYGYNVISKENAQLAWLPSLGNSISTVRGRVDGLETRLQLWQEGQKNLAARVAQVDGAWKAGLGDLSVQTKKLVSDAYQREHAALDQRTAILTSQIAQMATRQHAQQVQVAQLEKDLTRTKAELASVRESYAEELASLREQQISNRRELVSINNMLATDEVDFEVAKSQAREIAPGVSLHLTKTDPKHQTYAGWIALAANQRTIAVRGQDVQRPVVFLPTDGGQAYELVVTRITGNSASGYLLVPRSADTQTAALGSQKTTLGSSKNSSPGLAGMGSLSY